MVAPNTNSFDILQFFGTADNITAIAAATYVLSIAARTAWRKTIGSRRTTAKALHSLTPGNPRELVESRFGLPIYARGMVERRTESPDTIEARIDLQALYNARHGWLTIHYNNDRVVAFAFMITDRRFRFALGPTCRGMVDGYLGRAKYTDIESDPPPQVWAFIGPYNYGYSECHYFGRPGNYQYYSFSSTMHGWSTDRDFDNLPIGMIEVAGPADSDKLTNAEQFKLANFRVVNAPDTVAVFGHELSMFNRVAYSGSFDQDDIRNLEGIGPIGWLSRSAFSRREKRNQVFRRVLRRLRLVALE